MIFDNLFPLKVVINLDKRPDRLAECKKEFAKLGINPIRKPGVLYSGTGNKWWDGAIGCLLSHYHILQAALALDTNVFLFEDDVVFTDDYSYNLVENVCDDLNNNVVEWDMIYFGVNVMKPFYQTTSYLAKLNSGQSTVAYGVNKKFLKTLLSYIQLDKISKPIDLIYSEDVIPNHKVFVSVPMLVEQRDSYSDIEQMNTNYSSYLSKRYWENFRGIYYNERNE